MKGFILALSVLLVSPAFASSQLEGAWYGPEGKRVEFKTFENALTVHTRSYYSSGAPSDYFFDFTLPKGREVTAGEVLTGRVRSLDGHYGCVFDEAAKLMLNYDGSIKVQFPRLVFHREIREVREDRGYGYQRTVDWTRWGFVETVYRFPIERWRVISNKCVIDQRIDTTTRLAR